jgi:hypothetical protein
MASVPAAPDIVAYALDALLTEDRSRDAGTADEAGERAESEAANSAAVFIGALALAWRYRSHLGREDGESDRTGRQRRCLPRHWFAGRGLGKNRQ